MTGNGIFKRLAPFFLTLVAGIFIASIFIDVSSPFGFRERRIQRWNEMQQLRIERDQLKRENECLRRQLGSRRLDVDGRDDWTVAPVPAPNMDPPPPPPAIRTEPHSYLR
jgi:hypothetical protein